MLAVKAIFLANKIMMFHLSANLQICLDQVGWPNEFESGAREFETWSSQTKYFKIDTCRFLAGRLG